MVIQNGGEFSDEIRDISSAILKIQKHLLFTNTTYFQIHHIH